MSWYLHPKLSHCRRIILENIRRELFLGAYAHEKDARQPVIFNIEVFVKTANEDDELENAYNYDLAIDAVDALVNVGHIDLQETLVDRIAVQILKDHRVVAVLVRSEKPQAYSTVDSAGIEIFKLSDRL